MEAKRAREANELDAMLLQDRQARETNELGAIAMQEQVGAGDDAVTMNEDMDMSEKAVVLKSRTQVQKEDICIPELYYTDDKFFAVMRTYFP